ncbi:MAG TPA: bifunctional methylenetetrahydrofolate dehydrogenase/methenyltetrahydrofolate cyclohydrolase FolD [Alphaproteobacteria bacterium]
MLDGSPAEIRVPQGEGPPAAALIDGTALAAGLRARLAERVHRLNRRHGVTLGLAVVLVGDNPASQIYVRAKIRASEEVGISCVRHDLPASTVMPELRQLISQLNQDDRVDGLLLQLPLPPSINPDAVINALNPEKDVDGLHTINVGRLAGGRPGLVPCTPQGCMLLLRSVRPAPAGEHALIIGRSQLVGRPLAQLLLQADCTVTVAHSKTADLAALCRSATVVIAAAGRPELVRGDWIRRGAVVIDAGINRVTAPDGTSRIVGDVAFAEAASRASAMTPVPGGVGPMTVACLLENTFAAACRRRSLDPATV